MMGNYKQGEGCNVYEGAHVFDNVVLGDHVTIFPGAVVGRPPLSSGATFREVTSDPLPVHIGDHCVIGSNAVIYHDVKVAERSMVCDTACVREGVEIGERSIIAMGVTINYDTKIGNRVRIMDNTHITGNMVIEDDVFIAMLVTSANDNSMGREHMGVDEMTGAIVRRWATVGQGTCLLPNVEIGENSIVGSNSVVTKNVPPRSLAMGVPAKIIRELKTEEIREG